MSRLSCVVPDCRRTCAAGEFTEWICGRHWSQVDKRLRRAKARIYRRAKLRQWRDPWSGLASRVWRRCRAQAIERAMGITA